MSNQYGNNNPQEGYKQPMGSLVDQVSPCGPQDMEYVTQQPMTSGSVCLPNGMDCKVNHHQDDVSISNFPATNLDVANPLRNS